MRSLEEEIEELEKLDKVRIESAGMRDQGRDVLRNVQSGWGVSTTKIEDAYVLKALCDRKKSPDPQLVAKLEDLTLDEILGNSEGLPVMRAARSMQALAAAPDSAFSEALLAFYYQIVREIYTADAPDWRIGGARAAAGGSASAYVTGECVRAILGFARTLENTSAFVKEVQSLRRRREQLKTRAIHPRWCTVEMERLKRDFYTSVVRLLDNIALKLELPVNGERPDLLTPATVDEFIEKAPERIARAVARTAAAFGSVIAKVDEYRNKEKAEGEEQDGAVPTEDAGGFCRSPAKKRYERSETGYAVAMGALRQGHASASAAAVLFSAPGSDADAAMGQLATMFQSVAEGVRRLIHPARTYLSTVLDRELAAASSQARPRWDPAEMAFAAASYGYATGSFEDDRLRRAGMCLSEELSERGRFRCGSSFHVSADGKRVDVLGAEVLRAFAQLLENVETVPVEDGLVRSMLLFFEDTRRTFRNLPGSYGWCFEQVQEPALPLRWVTAASVLTLDRLNRMLDARINARVFRHFSVKNGKDLKSPSLRNLFYPDYGLRHPDYVPQVEGSWTREESVAMTLERMRTHVLGLSRREKPVPPLFSLILYGPPGTGKTTLVEALAKSSEAPFVEITPSDIVSAGADVVERRARAVFKALSLLTRVVILFDEFDPVLRRRSPGDVEPSTVFSFVTPGMLPKLKTLHTEAKRRSVAYVLITNLIGVLDGAAVRSGRFDRKLGIYPPDPLSREGRLLDEALAFKERKDWPDDFEERVRTVVQKTGGAQMEDLAQEGWFRRPADSKSSPLKGSPFDYFGGGSTLAPVERPETEAKVQPPPCREAPTESDRAEEREYLQRVWLKDWENRIWNAGPETLETEMNTPLKGIDLRKEKIQPPAVYLTWDSPQNEPAPRFRLYVVPENGDGHTGDSRPNASPPSATPHSP